MQGAPLEMLLEALKLPTTQHIGTVMKNVGSQTDCTTTETSKQLSFDNIKFEEQFEISPDKSRFPRKANIDVVIHGDYDFAIESKFIEPYRDKPKALKTAYIEDESLWNGLPNLYKLAKKISPGNDMFRYLDAAQLIKHILGLRNTYCMQKDKEDGQDWYRVRTASDTERRLSSLQKLQKLTELTSNILHIRKSSPL